MDLVKRLFQEQDLKYKEFSKSLIPGDCEIIGVRTPVLRKIAKEMKDTNWIDFFENYNFKYHEEKLVYGFLIGQGNLKISEKIKLIEKYVPLIDSWASCDQFTFKLKENEKEEYWNFCIKYFDKKGEYERRFAIVSMMKFIDENYIESIFELIDKVEHKEYYVKMAIAWLISVCYVYFPERTLEYIENNNLDKFTHNKAIQKIIESFRVSKESKDEIRKKKR